MLEDIQKENNPVGTAQNYEGKNGAQSRHFIYKKQSKKLASNLNYQAANQKMHQQSVMQ